MLKVGIQGTGGLYTGGFSYVTLLVQRPCTRSSAREGKENIYPIYLTELLLSNSIGTYICESESRCGERRTKTNGVMCEERAAREGAKCRKEK